MRGCIDRNRRRNDGDDPKISEIGGRPSPTARLVTGVVATSAPSWQVGERQQLLPGLRRLGCFRGHDARHHDRPPISVRVGRMLNDAWLRRVYTVLLFVIAFDMLRKLVA
jgi:hypothetical protein